MAQLGPTSPALLKSPLKEVVKEVDLHSAFIVVLYTQHAQVWITVLPANYTVPASIS